jgi:hypothetical protein
MTVTRYYRSKCGRHDFGFRFEHDNNRVRIVCTGHPPLSGRDDSVHKTHLYSSGAICFNAGKEPRSQREAERRAAEWAEYLLEYIRTGAAQ